MLQLAAYLNFDRAIIEPYDYVNRTISVTWIVTTVDDRGITIYVSQSENN